MIDLDADCSPEGWALSILERIDGSSSSRALVFGSLPPHGRDVDLLVPTVREYDEVARVLRCEGFERFRDRWVRVDAGAPSIVEVVLAEAWSLPDAERVALYEEALPLGRLVHVARPAPAHSLLILARRNAWLGGMTAKHRARIAAALAEDPRAWARARARAKDWDVTASLACLELMHMGERPSPALRVRAVQEAAARAGGGSVVRALQKRCRRILSSERGALFAFSGLDGAGKSRQAALLAQTLDALGRDPVLVWSPLGSTGVVGFVGGSAKRVIAALDRRPVPNAPASASAPNAAVSAVSVREHRLLSTLWVTVMGVANALTRLRIAAMLAAGRDVVCDRYALDAAVHLLERFGESGPVRAQIAVISHVSPTPRRAFFLEVRPEVALTRKIDRWSEAELGRRARLYQQLHAQFGALRIDGEQTAERVTADVARQTLEGLRSP